MLPSNRWLALATVLWLSACTLGPDYRRPDLPLPQTFRVTPAEAADLANSEWWRAFGDPELDALIESALAANKDLMLATTRVQQFEARSQAVGAAAYPTVGYSASGQRERRSQERPNGLRPGDSPSLNNFQLSADVSWELDLWGRVKRANEAARAELLSSQEARRGVMLSVVANVATSYVRLLELDERLAIARRAVDNRQRALDLMDQTFQGGSATRLGVERARAALEAERSSIPDLERGIAELENALSALLGRHPGPVARRSLDALALPSMPAGVPADVLTRRPDVMAAEQDLIAANARIGVAKTAYFPVLSLNAILGLAADDLQWLFAETARTGSFGGGLAGTLFDGGRIEGNIREAEATRQEMQVRFERTVLNALVEVESALVARSKTGERELLDARVVESQREVARLMRLRFEGGQSTLRDVLDAELNMVDGQIRQLQGKANTLQALVDVYKAMGGGWMIEREHRQAQSQGDTHPDVALSAGSEPEFEANR
jgi:multidrug efflux system outer membrane protein